MFPNPSGQIIGWQESFAPHGVSISFNIYPCQKEVIIKKPINIK